MNNKDLAKNILVASELLSGLDIKMQNNCLLRRCFEILEYKEWDNWDSVHEEGFCSVCYELESKGHLPDCQYVALMNDIKTAIKEAGDD